MFSNLKILVIGDVMLDHYIWGDATRISPEAPVPVVSVERDSYVPGGAANVACNLAGLGVQTTLLGRYAPDDGGNRLGILLSEKGIDLSPMGCRSKSTTIVKTRVVVQRQQMCRIDRELTPSVYKLSEALTLDSVTELVAGYDAIILSDYAKGTIDQDLVDMVCESLKNKSSEAGLPRPVLVMDPKPKRHLNIAGMDLMTPNRIEALQLAGLPSDHNAPFVDEVVCAAIHSRYAPKNLVITLGAEGMLLCREGELLERIPTEAKEVFDVSGAGDTVIATLTAGLASGMCLEESARLANRAAGIVVSHLGTSPIHANELFA